MTIAYLTPITLLNLHAVWKLNFDQALKDNITNLNLLNIRNHQYPDDHLASWLYSKHAELGEPLLVVHTRVTHKLFHDAAFKYAEKIRVNALESKKISADEIDEALAEYRIASVKFKNNLVKLTRLTLNKTQNTH